ncbi:hypothetical protein [Capnocytophaga granulosa]|jgi:hypothetical protein|uniref:hypothetical protein n=1 Tax=Capnocytophaga granulosa TaxID=45242 RepID=UPI0023F451AA|nr:hypothetical protein [Capnocytophaga granulosa]
MKRYIINLIGKILLKYKYRNKPDAFNELYKITGAIKNNSTDNSYILIAPIRMSQVSNLFEILIGIYAMIRGKKVKFFLCGDYLKNNDYTPKGWLYSFLSRSINIAEQNRVTKLFNLDVIKITDLLTDNDIKYIKENIDKRSFIKKEDFIFEGYNLKDDIDAGCMRYTLKSEIEAKDISLIKGYALTSFILAKACTKLIKRDNISHLIISHGIYSTWGSVLSVFRQNHIPALVWGRGYVGKGKIIFGHNMGYHEEFIKEPLPSFKLTNTQKELTLQYFKDKMDNSKVVDYVNYYRGLKTKEFDIESFDRKINSYKIRFGMFTNIPWDGQVFNKTNIFPTTRFYLKNTINWFLSNPDALLIIRAHPAERTRKTAKGTETFQSLLLELFPKNLPDNIIFLSPDNPITSYTLLNKINCAILFGSTMSLEIAIQHIPVIQTGKFNVSNKNIVFEPNSLDDFYRLLDRAKNGNLQVTEEMYQNALRYGYYFIFNRHIEDTAITLGEGLSFKKFNFNTIEEFKNNSFLSFVYDEWILKNNRLIENNYE